MYLKTQKCWKFSISKSRKIIFKVHGKLTSGLEMKVGRQENRFRFLESMGDIQVYGFQHAETMP